MHRLLILTAVALCFVFALVAPAGATKYCGPIPELGGANDCCECVVWNFGTAADTGVTITLYTVDGPSVTGPLTIVAGGQASSFHCPSGDGYCACKVTGENTTTRAALTVEASDSWTPLSTAVCGP
jgi:hypothetical protein